MIFVTTDEQLKEACSAVTVDLRIESVRSFLLEVETDFILIIGKVAKDELVAAPDHEATVFIRAASVHLALAAYASSGSMQISDSGMHVSKSDRLLPASDKKIVNFRRDHHRTGWAFFEKAVQAMDGDAVAFAGWRASEERERFRELLVDYSFEFNRYSKLTIEADVFQRLRKEISTVETDMLEPILGATLLGKLRDKKNGEDGGLGDADSLWRKLLGKALRVLGPMTLAEALPYQLVELGMGGVFQLSEAALSSTSDNIESRAVVQQRVLGNVLLRLVTEGEAEQERLRKFLNKHRDVFADAPVHEIAPLARINEGNEDSNVYFL